MPNLPGKGIWGAKADGSWCAPSSVWGVKDDGSWCDASYVWGVDANGNYVLVWGKFPAAPATVTATWVQPATVKVTWTPPAVNTNTQWIVRRSDGSIVATVPVGTLTVTDPNPLLTSTVTTNSTLAAYTVEGSDGSTSSARVSSNTLTWNLTSTTPTVVVTPSGTTADVTLTWAKNATYGAPQGWRFYSPVLGWIGPATPVDGDLTTYTLTGQVAGTANSYRVVPFTQLADGSWVQAGNGVDVAAPIVPNVPTGVTLTALTAPYNTLRLAWTAPTGTVTDYEIQKSTDNTTWTAHATDTASPSDLSAGETAYYMRIRSRAPGGNSAWVTTAKVTPISPPAASLPTSVVLTALSSPVSTARLTWVAGTGGSAVSAYEVETSINGTTWAASSDDTSPSDYLNTTATQVWMRVRALTAVAFADPSAWVQKGPVTMIHDTTPPAAPVITSFKPESSYGRMVVRFTTANVSDFNSYRIDYNTDGGAYVVGSWVAANPNVAVGVALGKTFVATDVAGVRVYFKDDAGNISAADTATYALVATPKIIDATDSATWRVDEWRTDGTAGSTGVMHGRTSSGENYGCWFYGEALQDFVSTHTVISATLDYCRDGSSQGSGSAIQPGVWVHNFATQPAGSPVSSFTDGPVLGSGVARSGTTGGSCALSSAQIAQLATYKGLGVYRQTSNTNDADAASFYMRLYPFGTNSGGKVSGRVTLTHLG